MQLWHTTVTISHAKGHVYKELISPDLAIPYFYRILYLVFTFSLEISFCLFREFHHSLRGRSYDAETYRSAPVEATRISWIARSGRNLLFQSPNNVLCFVILYFIHVTSG